MTPTATETAVGGLQPTSDGGFFAARARPAATCQVVKNLPWTEWEDRLKQKPGSDSSDAPCRLMAPLRRHDVRRDSDDRLVRQNNSAGDFGRNETNSAEQIPQR